MENGSRKIGLRVAAGFIMAITIIVAVFASGITLPGLESNPSLGSEQGRLTVLLMDAPVDVDELWINVTGIEVHNVGNDDDVDGGWLSLDLSGVDNTLLFDLLEYQMDGTDDKLLTLTDGFIPVGTYNKIRMQINASYALYYEYAEGKVVTDGEGNPVISYNQTLRVPSNRIEVITRFDITEDLIDEHVVVLIDMQPDFVSISNSGNLKPVLKATISQQLPETKIETLETPTNP